MANNNARPAETGATSKEAMNMTTVSHAGTMSSANRTARDLLVHCAKKRGKCPEQTLCPTPLDMQHLLIK
jgi:hypothetical protein